MPSRKASPQGSVEVLSRVTASLVGAYGFVWGTVALITAVGLALGMSYADAQSLAYLLAFLIFLGCFCWAFSAASAFRVWLAFAGGGIALSTAAWSISRTLL